MQTLVLNATYEIMKIVSWRQAVKLFFIEKVDIIEEYEKNILTPTLIMKVPAVVKYKKLIKIKHQSLRFSKTNVYTRDNFICQYCNCKLLNKEDLTIDHIIPKSRGGVSSWINCITACKKCNMRKADRTPKEANMLLYKEPRQPNQNESHILSIKFNKNIAPDIWKNYY